MTVMLECRGRCFFGGSLADGVERLAGDAMLSAERAHRPARGIIGPLRDGEAGTRINELRQGHSAHHTCRCVTTKTRGSVTEVLMQNCHRCPAS